MEQTPPHVALVPSPGMGHLIPLVEFSKRLIHKHNFNVTIILLNDGPLSKAQKTFLDSLPSSINHIILPPVNLVDLPDDVGIETRMTLTVSRSLPSLRNVIKDLKLVALVVDVFGTDAFDVAKEFGISPYLFFPTTAMCLSFYLYLPELDEKVSCEYRDLPEPVRIPGCLPIDGKQLIDPVQDRKNDAYKWMLHNVKKLGTRNLN